MPTILLASILALTLCSAGGQQDTSGTQAACDAAPDAPGSASAMLQQTGPKKPGSTKAAYREPTRHAAGPTESKIQTPTRKKTFDSSPAEQRRGASASQDSDKSSIIGTMAALGDSAMQKQAWSLEDAADDGDGAANSNMDEVVVEDTAMQASHRHYERSAKPKDKSEVGANSENEDDTSEEESMDPQSEDEGGEGANEPEEENEEEAAEEETTVTDDADDETENTITDSKEKDKGGNAGGKNNKKDKQKNKKGKKKGGADGDGEFLWKGMEKHQMGQGKAKEDDRPGQLSSVRRL